MERNGAFCVCIRPDPDIRMPYNGCHATNYGYAMKSSLAKIGVSLRSSARDVSLIVIGILVAFFLDAWWKDQIEQKEISDTLHAVYVDFSSTKDELSAVFQANVIYIDSVTKLISLGMDDIERLDATSKSNLTKLLPTGGITFDPVLGSVDALISSGQLNKVRNLQVRSLIGAWSALMDEIGEDQEILIDMYMAQQERSVALGIYVMSLDGDLADDEILAIVIQDSEILNRLAAHRFAIQSLNDELRMVEEHLDKILRLLDRELGIEESK